MQLKEEIYGVSGRRRARRAIDDDEESEAEYYSDEEDSAEVSQRAGTKRTRAIEV